MAVGDVYYLLDRQVYEGQECLNTYWYIVQNDDSGSNAQELLDSYTANVLPDILAFQEDNLSHNVIDCYLWADPSSDFAQDATGYAGDQSTANITPSFLAVAYRSPSGGPGTRYSYKRYAGVPEEFINGNTVAAGAPFVDLQTSLGSVLSGAGGGQYAPVQVARSVAGVNVLPPLGTGAPIVNRSLQGTWLKQSAPTTQSSRKP